jgi:hypothetical protein
MDGADFVGLIVTIAVWPTVVVLRGWPLNRIESRVPRLLANNSATVAGGLLTYWALSASGLPAETINSVCGCVIVGGPLGAHTPPPGYRTLGLSPCSRCS